MEIDHDKKTVWESAAATLNQDIFKGCAKTWKACQDCYSAVSFPFIFSIFFSILFLNFSSKRCSLLSRRFEQRLGVDGMILSRWLLGLMTGGMSGFQ